ncbi:MAG: AbrB/MazE/SpoVT family DNA-binding domain-containing protein [Candidatus Omnitrophica bacterium]|nr:AbrB/MazE/SpoVT family DNA-binding domain-containing protein [Candidatus Omnitrophota bacterium]
MLAKVTRGNQVTLPKDIVKKAHIREGNDYVDVEYMKGVICLKPVDIEERLPAEAYERLLKKAFTLEPGDKVVSPEEAKVFLKKRVRRD